MPKRFKKPKPLKKAPAAPTIPQGDVVQVAGFPDFWQTAHDKFSDFFKSVGPLTGLINKFLKSPIAGTMPRLIHAMAGLVSNSFGALVVLGLNGYGHDAMRITRSMFETMVDAKYIQLHPEQANVFLNFHWVRKKETLEYFKEYAPGEIASAPKEKLDELLAEFDAVKAEFENKKGQIRKTWCKVEFRQRTKDVGLGEYYPTFYAEASDFQHGNVQALVAQAEDALSITPAPSLGSMQKALQIGHLSTLGVLDVLNDVAKLGLDDELKAAVEDFKKAWANGK